MLVERLGQNLSCSTIHFGVFLSGDPKPFLIWGSFSAFALHWRFSRRSMLYETWPSLIRDPWWCFLPKRLWCMFWIRYFEGLGQVYQPIILVWYRYFCRCCRSYQNAISLAPHAGAAIEARYDIPEEYFKKFFWVQVRGFLLSLSGIPWFSPPYLLDTGSGFWQSVTIGCFMHAYKTRQLQTKQLVIIRSRRPELGNFPSSFEIGNLSWQKLQRMTFWPMTSSLTLVWKTPRHWDCITLMLRF